MVVTTLRLVLFDDQSRNYVLTICARPGADRVTNGIMFIAMLLLSAIYHRGRMELVFCWYVSDCIVLSFRG